MNERIKELVEQATELKQNTVIDPVTYTMVPSRTYRRELNAEKFAEMIVHQMLEITDAHTEVFQTDRDRAVIEHIKQSVKTHFGAWYDN